MQRMNSKEAAEYIGVHVNTLRKYVHEEDLPVLRIPGRSKWTFHKDLVDDWIIKRSTPVIVNPPKKEDREDYGKLRIMSP